VTDHVKGLLRRVGRTRVGKVLIHASVLPDTATTRFSNVERWPAELRGFDDLAFLLCSNQLNHGIASLQLDEAALLYRLAREASRGPFAEIGRFKGGSTFIFASALPPGVELWSYDSHVASRPNIAGGTLDAELEAALARYRLDRKVHLVVADSRNAEPPPDPIELLFVDGDHTYEGASADFIRWGPLVCPGGHLLFHDAVDSGGYGNYYPGTAQLVGEVERDPTWERQPDTGSIAHFVSRHPALSPGWGSSVPLSPPRDPGIANRGRLRTPCTGEGADQPRATFRPSLPPPIGGARE
jgi:predicted O-methyltransferase YrrM